MRTHLRSPIFALAVALAAAAAALALAGFSSGATVADPVVMAAGDIACDPGNPSFNGGNGTFDKCRQKYTAQQLAGADAVLALGDLQYENGTLTTFNASYDPSWGQYKAITYPAPGNHEYNTPNAAGYYAYWGARAGDPSKGYYSFDLGAWHLIALNSECVVPDYGLPCGPSQQAWLEADLAANPRACILAYWHRPRFSGGTHGDDPRFGPIWQALYAAGADVVLNGHDHDYERFTRLNPAGQADPNGIREWVVGTGGSNLVFFGSSIRPIVEKRSRTVFGVLKLTLHPTSYDWEFLIESETASPPPSPPFTDTGSTNCGVPTAVRLSSFSAAARGRGVVVRWRTESEVGLVGFHVFRSRSGKLVRLTRMPLEAAGAAAGRSYVWRDRAGAAGNRYRLQALSADGRRWFVGAVRAR